MVLVGARLHIFFFFDCRLFGEVLDLPSMMMALVAGVILVVMMVVRGGGREERWGARIHPNECYLSMIKCMYGTVVSLPRFACGEDFRASALWVAMYLRLREMGDETLCRLWEPSPGPGISSRSEYTPNSQQYNR